MSVIQNDLEPHMSPFKRHVAEAALGLGISAGMCIFIYVRHLLREQDQAEQVNGNRARHFSLFTCAIVTTATVAAVGTGLVLNAAVNNI